MKKLIAICILGIAAGALIGRSADFWDKAEKTSTTISKGAQTGGAVVGSPVAQTIATATGTEPARKGTEYVLYGIELLTAGLATYFAKKAAAERTKKKAYKAACSPDGLNIANKTIYGDEFNPAKSK